MPRATPLDDSMISRRTLMRTGALGLAAMLPACSEVAPTPRAIKWGRDLCEFCHMVFADKRYVAQFWDGDYNRARIFDDFGCAVLAAFDRKIADDSPIPFWVSDEARPEAWLDARTAQYRDGVKTPMDYGHAAGSTAAYRLSFRTAAAAIRAKAGCEHRG